MCLYQSIQISSLSFLTLSYLLSPPTSSPLSSSLTPLLPSYLLTLILLTHPSPIPTSPSSPPPPSYPPLSADDSQALIWDIQQMPQGVEVPILAYQAEGPINQVHWSTVQSDWIAICFKDIVEILRV